MANDKKLISKPSPLGVKLKEELKKRQLSQKDFAKQIGLSPSHLSDIIMGRRPASLELTHTFQVLLGVPIQDWMDLQVQYSIEKKENKDEDDFRAGNIIAAYDEIISVGTLLKIAKIKKINNKQCLAELQKVYNLPTPDLLRESSDISGKGFFRKSEKTGLDPRMIATWVVLARNSVRGQKVESNFDTSTLKSLAKELSDIFHRNSNTIISTRDILSRYGIKFSIVERIDHASIDGYSFLDGNIPAIVVTKRFDRIDNFAFAVLHETYHVYSHLNNKQCQMISIADYNSQSAEERAANEFASKVLINPSFWSDAPSVQLYKPWNIQKQYTEWATVHNLNKWIVLGQISHFTGMYKFKSDDSRRIH